MIVAVLVSLTVVPVMKLLTMFVLLDCTITRPGAPNSISRRCTVTRIRSCLSVSVGRRRLLLDRCVDNFPSPSNGFICIVGLPSGCMCRRVGDKYN